MCMTWGKQLTTGIHHLTDYLHVLGYLYVHVLPTNNSEIFTKGKPIRAHSHYEIAMANRPVHTWYLQF